MILEHKFKMGIKDIGKDNFIKNRAILEMLEDIGAYHSDLAGYGASDIEKTNVVWILAGWNLDVIKRPKYNDDIKVETWSRKVERLYAYRDFQIKDKEGNIIVIGTSRWIFVDTDRRRPVRLTADIADLYESETDKNVFTEEMEDIKCGDYLFKKDYCIQRRDIDINQHMNNLSYLDMAYEILPDNIYNNKVFNNIRIVYKKEILYGENVECYYEEQNNKHIITAKSQDNINAIIELS